MNNTSNVEYINKAGKNLVNIFKYTIIYILFVVGIVLRLFSNVFKYDSNQNIGDGSYNYNAEVDFLLSVNMLQLYGTVITTIYFIVILIQVYRAGQNLRKVSAEKVEGVTTSETIQKIFDANLK